MAVFLAEAPLSCQSASPARVSRYCINPVRLTWIFLIPVRGSKQPKDRRGGICFPAAAEENSDTSSAGSRADPKHLSKVQACALGHTALGVPALHAGELKAP